MVGRPSPVLAFLSVFLWAALTPPTAAGEEALRVTVTVPPVAWLVSQVAGPAVTVEPLVDVGDKPETFQPTDQRITRVARSAVFFRVGIPAENGPWVRALEEGGNLRIVDLRQGLELREMESHHHSHGHSSATETGGHDHHHHHSHDSPDPHIWLSPLRLEVMAGTVARTLAAVDPGGAEDYHQRAAALGARLRALDGELRERLEPVRGRSFFVFHPAWGYLADDYGLHQIAIEVEGKDPTEAELTRLVRRARSLEIHTLFVEPRMRSGAPRIVARAVGAELETLDPLAEDLPANLRRVAERLRAALLPLESTE